MERSYSSTSPTIRLRKSVAATRIQNFLLPFIRKFTVLPFITKVSFNITDRINYAILVIRYLKGISNKQCLVKKDDNYTISNEKIKLIKKIGTEGKYGAIYHSSGSNEGKHLKFCTKIMEKDSYNILESQILKFLTKLVMFNKTPHFPIMYKTFECNNKSMNVPHFVKDKEYLINLNELANGDLRKYVESPRVRNYNYINNAFAQVLLSILSLHAVGYYHKDSHYGNFLFHEIEPGGYIKYKIFGKTVYLKNIGYLWVIWDFGFSEKIVDYDNDYTFIEDYFHIMRAFLNQYTTYKDIDEILPRLKEQGRKYRGMIDDNFTIPKETTTIVRTFFNIYKHLLSNNLLNKLANEKLLFHHLIIDTDLFIKESDLPSDAKIINRTAYALF